MSEQDSSINNSLDKALSLLEYFTSENPTRGLSEISRLSSIPKATVYRLINTFEKNGYLRKLDIRGRQNQYALGIKFLMLGTIVSDTVELKEVALPHMKRLRDILNEDVQLVMRDHDRAVYVEKLVCDHPVRLFTRTGRSASLNAGACPRAILSFLKDDEIREIIRLQHFTKYTETTIVDADKLWDSIEESRKNGYTVSFGEMEPETVAVGAPIFNHEGVVVASISTAGPASRFDESRLPLIIEKTVEATRSISRDLGYTRT